MKNVVERVNTTDLNIFQTVVCVLMAEVSIVQTGRNTVIPAKSGKRGNEMRPYKEIMESGKVWDTVMFGKLVGGLIKLPDCGTCSVMFGENEDGWEHVSVSPKHKYNIPTWNDMCVLKDIFFDDEEEVYQIHPKKSEYVNLSENCLHLWKPIGRELGELVEKRYE